MSTNVLLLLCDDNNWHCTYLFLLRTKSFSAWVGTMRCLCMFSLGICQLCILDFQYILYQHPLTIIELSISLIFVRICDIGWNIDPIRLSYFATNSPQRFLEVFLSFLDYNLTLKCSGQFDM